MNEIQIMNIKMSNPNKYYQPEYLLRVILFFFQDDHNDLAGCPSMWLKLINDQTMKDDTREEIKRRFEQVATPYHLISYLIDHRKTSKNTENDDIHKQVWTPLLQEQQEEARNYIFEQKTHLTAAIAAYESEDSFIFPKVSFSSRLNVLSPLKYWQYIRKISTNDQLNNFVL